MKITIKHRHNGSTLFEGEFESIKHALIEALKGDADLRGANLSGAYLCGTDLRDANLVGANLVGVYLRDAYLRGANLSGSNLSRADLGGSNLSNSNLRNSDLIGSNLSNSDLIGSNMRNSNLDDAYLSNANLSRAYMRGVHMRNSNLSGADLSYSDLGGAYLINSNLRNSNLHNSNLRGAYLCGVHLIHVGARSDGYDFYAHMRNNGELWIKGGCRYMEISKARDFWQETRDRTQLGEETMRLLDNAEQLAKIRGWVDRQAFDDGSNSLNFVEVSFGDPGNPPTVTRSNKAGESKMQQS